MKNTYQSTQPWLSQCCVSFKKLMVLALAVFSSSALMAQPANDLCSGAIPITVGADGSCPGASVNYTTSGATDDGPQTCDGTTDNRGIWFSFVAPATGTVNVQINEISGNQEAAIYSSCGGASVWCDGTPNNEVVGGLTSGATYYLLVWRDGFLAPGSFDLCLQEFVPPTNDNCVDAISVPVNTTVSGNTSLATDSNPPTCNFAGDGSGGGLWYTVTGTGLDITASLCGSSYDTQIAVYTGSCGALSCVTGNDDFCGLQSQVTWNSLAGTTYYVYVDGFGSGSGGFTLDVSGMLPPPIDNDNCSTANTISCGETIQGSTIGAFPDAVRRCGPGSGAGGVWYTFNPNDGGFYQSLSVCDAANFDTKITVYYGDCNRLRCLGSVDNSEGCGGGTSEMVFVPFFGRTHYVLVETTDPAVPGVFDLTYDCNYSFRGATPGNVITAGVDQAYETIKLYPNPAQDVLNVELDGFMGDQVVLRIHNGLGQVMQQRRIGEVEAQTERFNTSNLQAGMYYLTVQVEGKETFTEKFMVGTARP